MTADRLLSLLALLLFAFCSNLPLGYLRAGSRRFSFSWFVLIHFSIPFIILLRSLLGFHWPWIPLTLLCAVAGQLLGGRIGSKRLQ